MRLVLHREIPDDRRLHEQWNGLVGKMERPEVFYTYEWASSVERAYRGSLHPLLMLAYENDTLVGVASLATEAKERDVRFLAATTADYCDFVCSPKDRVGFASAVLAELRRLKMPNLVLANLPAESATLRAITEASQLGYRLFSRPAYRCAQVVLHSSAERELAQRSVSRRQATRRYFAAMEKVAPVRVDHRKSGSEIAPLLRDFGRAHIARCLLAGRLSNLVSAERRAFLLELSGLLSQRGWMTFSRLLVGNRAVAWNYGFQFAGGWFWYQPTFDFRWQQYSPGFCLLTKIVEEACHNEAIELVDMGLGDEEYKERVATASRATLHVTATQQWSRWAREALRYRATAALKTFPRVESWLRAGRNRLSRLGAQIQTAGFLGLSRGWWTRAREALFGQPEVFFFEWREQQIYPQAGVFAGSLQTRELDFEALADAAMFYSDDEETLGYLLRAARRLRAKSSQGFVLADARGVPVHFAWAARFDGFFISQLRHKVNAPSPEAILLFDCWTPLSARGRGYYGQAISRAASQLRAAGKNPWIFSSATNQASLRGVRKTGFEPRFSLIRRRTWGSPRVMMASQTAKYCQPTRGVSAA